MTWKFDQRVIGNVVWSDPALFVGNQALSSYTYSSAETCDDSTSQFDVDMATSTKANGKLYELILQMMTFGVMLPDLYEDWKDIACARTGAIKDRGLGLMNGSVYNALIVVVASAAWKLPSVRAFVFRRAPEKETARIVCDSRAQFEETCGDIADGFICTSSEIETLRNSEFCDGRMIIEVEHKAFIHCGRVADRAHLSNSTVFQSTK
ncbi:hypothetical protein BKA67DRAFT_537480 [Truncatella angustata]|uniref:Uncharacterized protein n=1 Tax=Truncatella angustata TaxID=152316 RepID=A0A9P8ZUZ8_9PEZI|nr:uncharacterized protein BKA67DRAFT_537480 [Truncatella angustata]KAH6651615.1 hypothetical protein BKA67DRAFT_537480 [Truncatella angustata]